MVLLIFKNRHIRRKNVLEFLMIAHIGNRAFYISVYKKLTNLQSCALLYSMRRNLLNGMCGNNRIAISIDREPYVFNFAVPILSLPSYTALRIQNQILTVTDRIIRI